MAVFLASYGIFHVATGVGLALGRAWSRWVGLAFIGIDCIQGLCYLGAGVALLRAEEPIYSVAALALGTAVTTWTIVVGRLLSREG